jgi:hypothetical protein
MKFISCFLSVLIFSFLCSFNISAQQTVDASGGEATGSGGTVSYSVGQVLYNTFSDANNSEAQGVQQPFEISVVNGTELLKGISLKYKVYPNPAHSLLILELDNELPEAFVQLFDITGKLINTAQVSTGINQISTEELIPATYILKLLSGNQLVRSFKIIKN